MLDRKEKDKKDHVLGLRIHAFASAREWNVTIVEVVDHLNDFLPEPHWDSRSLLHALAVNDFSFRRRLPWFKARRETNEVVSRRRSSTVEGYTRSNVHGTIANEQLESQILRKFHNDDFD